ncbi:tigger transposable element-derived protein 2-like [Schistocerca serialis cubense]|uniref:tigger transposable element-derived protein 2-like n=1 Tax=Schistocerca serialis cubense TaxID=2023355 RepID=UPI00214EF9E2|nr:tigger transposable element-derived protein 2-like [Schistocerca serialis cubense]
MTFHEMIERNEQEFLGSDGWLDRFKKWHGIREIANSGESLSGDEAAISDLKKKLHTVVDKGGSTENGIWILKKSKESIIVLTYSNATGSRKLRLTLLGKSKASRAFRWQPADKPLPLWYTNQSNKAWMNSAIFKEWFRAEFAPAAAKYMEVNWLPRKVDNAPSQPDDLQERDFKVVFPSRNVTSPCQPMDQGVLEAMEKRYRRKLLEYLIDVIDAKEDFVQSLKKIDVLEKLLDHKATRQWWEEGGNTDTQADVPKIDEYHVILANLLEKLPGCEDVGFEDVEEWMEYECFDLTEEEIAQIATSEKAS